MSSPLATRTAPSPDPIGIAFSHLQDSWRDVRDAMIAAGHVPAEHWRVPGGGVHHLPCTLCDVEGRIECAYPPGGGSVYRAYGPPAGRCTGRAGDAD